MEPEELKSNNCEIIWVQIKIKGAAHLYIGSAYRPPDKDDPEYINIIDSQLARIPQGAHVWLGGDFNLPGIDWKDGIVQKQANRPKIWSQLLTVTKDRFMEQQVKEPTRITENSETILDLFFTNNETLVNNVQVIPGISDHKAVYVESSLKTTKEQETT